MHRVSDQHSGGFAYHPCYVLARGQPSPRLGYLPASPHRLTTTGSGPTLRQPLLTVRRPQLRAGFGWLASPGSSGAPCCRYGNINPLSIDYACRPRLRSRLTLGGLAWPRNPWSFGGGVSHSAFATHACILTREPSTTRFRGCFTRHTTLPYPSQPPLGVLLQ